MAPCSETPRKQSAPAMAAATASSDASPGTDHVGPSTASASSAAKGRRRGTG